jgi:hypothetical protein
MAAPKLAGRDDRATLYAILAALAFLAIGVIGVWMIALHF